jgi:hypothetical protein
VLIVICLHCNLMEQQFPSIMFNGNCIIFIYTVYCTELLMMDSVRLKIDFRIWFFFHHALVKHSIIGWCRVHSHNIDRENVAEVQPVGHWELPSAARNLRAEAGCIFYLFISFFFCDYDSQVYKCFSMYYFPFY